MQSLARSSERLAPRSHLHVRLVINEFAFTGAGFEPIELVSVSAHVGFTCGMQQQQELRPHRGDMYRARWNDGAAAAEADFKADGIVGVRSTGATMGRAGGTPALSVPQ